MRTKAVKQDYREFLNALLASEKLETKCTKWKAFTLIIGTYRRKNSNLKSKKIPENLLFNPFLNLCIPFYCYNKKNCHILNDFASFFKPWFKDSESFKEWVSEWKGEWVRESVSEWVSERLSELVCVWVSNIYTSNISKNWFWSFMYRFQKRLGMVNSIFWIL